MRLFLAVLLAATAAFADPKPFKCSAKGGAPWHELRSAHFIVDTDATGEKVARLIQTLETYEAQEMGILVGSADLPGRLRVVAFASQGDYADLAGRNAAGTYLHSDLYGPYIMLPIGAFAADGEAVAHEVAHFVSFFLFPAQPSWFSEGFAEWVQTIATNATESRAEVGSHLLHGTRAQYAAGTAPRSLHESLLSAPQVPGKELLQWNGVEDPATPWRYHAWSWILYHWLWNARSKQFADYEQRLMNGEDPAAAWKAALPDLDPDDPAAMTKLDGELYRYKSGGRYLAMSLDAKGDGKFQEVGPLSPADVHALVSILDPTGDAGQRTARQAANVSEALSEDPLHPESLYAQNKDQLPEATAALRKAVAAKPRNARAQFLLGHLLLQDPAQDPLPPLKAAVALDPDHGRAHTDLAFALLRAGKAKEAIPVANRAVDLSPWDPSAVDSLARVAAAVGKCKEAVALEKRELWLLSSPDDTAQLQKRIAADGASCGAPPTAK